MRSAGVDNHFVCSHCSIQSLVKLANLFLWNARVISTKETKGRVFNVRGFFKQGGIGASKLPAHPRIKANYAVEVKVLFRACQKRKSPTHTKTKCERSTSCAFPGM